MLPLGQMLVERGWIDQQQLDDAVELQRRRGARIGTCLLELGAISEDLLVKILSEQLGVPAAGIDDLRDVPRKVFGMLPAEIATERLVVPFRQEGRKVDIALLEVHDLHLHDEIAFVLGRRVKVHIANEARIFEALERYYGKPCPGRFTGLLKRLNESRDAWRQPDAHALGAKFPGATSRLPDAPDPGLAVPSSLASPPEPVGSAEPAGASAPPAAGSELLPRSVPLTSAERRELEAARAILDEAPTPGLAITFDEGPEMALQEVETGLDRVTSTDEVGRILLSYLTRHFLRVVLLRVDHDTVSGWMGRGPGIDLARLEAFHTGFDRPSIFLNLSRGGSFFLGKLPEMEAHAALTACWGETPEHECFLLPIRLRDRLVSLIYGDRDCLGLDGLDVPMLSQLAHKISLAFEVCIMHQKLRRTRAQPESPWPDRIR